MIDLLNLVFRF